MGDSQSRYGIMEELNNRKIKEREKLSNLEKDLDAKEFEATQKEEEIKQNISDENSTYKMEYKTRQRQREVNLKMVTRDFERVKKELEEDIKEDKENYEDKHKKSIFGYSENLTKLKNETDQYAKTQNKKITDKKAVIQEIESGIKDLKEMSAEQKDKD